MFKGYFIISHKNISIQNLPKLQNNNNLCKIYQFLSTKQANQAPAARGMWNVERG